MKQLNRSKCKGDLSGCCKYSISPCKCAKQSKAKREKVARDAKFSIVLSMRQKSYSAEALNQKLIISFVYTPSANK